MTEKILRRSFDKEFKVSTSAVQNKLEKREKGFLISFFG